MLQAKYPPLPDEENRIPDAMDPVTHEATTRHNFPDVAPTKFTDSNTQSNEVSIMGQKQDERQPSFFSQPGILAGEITVPFNFCEILIFVLHFVLAVTKFFCVVQRIGWWCLGHLGPMDFFIRGPLFNCKIIF